MTNTNLARALLEASQQVEDLESENEALRSRLQVYESSKETRKYEIRSVDRTEIGLLGSKFRADVLSVGEELTYVVAVRTSESQNDWQERAEIIKKSLGYKQNLALVLMKPNEELHIYEIIK